MQTESSDARSSILKSIGGKKKINILLSLQTESSEFVLQAMMLWQAVRQVCPGHFWLLKFGKVPEATAA
jgi:hypothetical protein